MSVFGLGGARSDVRALSHKTTPRLGLHGLHLKDIVYYRKRMNIAKCYRSLMICETID